MGQDRSDAGRHTRGSIGKVIPLRQHRRNPALGSALARLIAGAPALSTNGDPALGPIRGLLAAARAVGAHHIAALEAGLNLARVADGALSELRGHLLGMARIVAGDREEGAGERRDREEDARARLERLAQEITRVAENAEFEARPLLAGADGPVWRAPGPPDEALTLSLPDHTAAALGVTRLDPGDASAPERIAAALARVDVTRAALAAFERRVGDARKEKDVARANVAAASAVPADVDAALEQARSLRDWVVANLRRAAGSQGVAPAVALKLIG